MNIDTERERERERAHRDGAERNPNSAWWRDGVGLDGREGSGVGSLDWDVGVDDLVVMSLGMLCVRDGRKMKEERRKSGLAIVGERK
jgi:hypothetical protein